MPLNGQSAELQIIQSQITRQQRADEVLQLLVAQMLPKIPATFRSILTTVLAAYKFKFSDMDDIAMDNILSVINQYIAYVETGANNGNNTK